MYRVALNVAISFSRAESRRVGRVVQADSHLFETAADAQPPVDARAEMALALVEQLDDLSRALVLLYLDGYPYNAIADILGLSVTNVATKLQRVKTRLRDQTLRTLQKDNVDGTR